jgi:hypothetical protein
MDEEQKIRIELFGKTRDDVLRRQLSNTENYDKAVLSLGTAFLGFSLAFLKDFVSYKNAVYALLLPTSWVLFCLSIIATLVSFFISQKGLSSHLKNAEKYYLGNDDTYLTKKNHAADWTDRVNLSSAILFIFAIIATIVFVIANLANGANMSEKTAGGVGVATAGAQIPVMQLAPVAPAPTPAQPTTGSNPSASPQNTGESK